MPSNYHAFTLGRRTPRSSAADNHQWRLQQWNCNAHFFNDQWDFSNDTNSTRRLATVVCRQRSMLAFREYLQTCRSSRNASMVTNNASYYPPSADGHAQWSMMWRHNSMHAVLQCSLFSMTTVTLCKKDYNRFLIYTFLSYFTFVLSIWGGKLILFAKKTKTDFWSTLSSHISHSCSSLFGEGNWYFFKKD